MMLVWRMRQEAEYKATRAIVQSAVDPEGKHTQDAWSEFNDAFYPYLTEQKRKGDKAALEYLMKEVAKGPFRITPLVSLVKSRLYGKRRKDADSDLPPVRVRKGHRRR